MADNINEKRHDSWEEHCLEKGKESGLFGSIARGKLSFFDNLPKKCARYKAALRGDVAQNHNANFILIPVGANMVRCIHSCFLFSELEEESSGVVGILGSRRTSHFNSLNIDHATKRFLGPKTTRTSDPSGDEGWLPTVEEFIGCANADEFRNLVSEEQESPVSELWEQAQSF